MIFMVNAAIRSKQSILCNRQPSLLGQRAAGRGVRYLLAAALSVTLITGCTPRFQADEATEVAITPLTVMAEGLNQQQLSAFLSHNRTLLLTEPVTVAWSGNNAKNNALLFAKRLRSLGADPANLQVREAPGGLPGVSVSYVTHQVQVPDCLPYDSINALMFDAYRQPRQQGCFVQSNRWQSLVHPERAYKAVTTGGSQP